MTFLPHERNKNDIIPHTCEMSGTVPNDWYPDRMTEVDRYRQQAYTLDYNEQT